MATTTPGYQARTDTENRRDEGSRVRRTFTETKAFYKTSEFMVWLFGVAAVLIATYSDSGDSLTEWRGWVLVSVMSAAYILTRGIAKAGTREPYSENYER